MQGIEAIRDLVEERISELDFSREPKNLYNPISYTLNNKGKRIRPILTLLACNMFSENIENAMKPAIGLEVFHNFTLLHDDIMDDAPVRRGKPTVHMKWNANTAILSGDTMMVEAYKLIAEAPDYCLREVLKLFSELSIGVCEGQMYDMEFEDRTSVTVNEYLKMIELKTSVLIAGALKMGAIIGKANKNDAENLYKFGINLGLAFQLLDDWLDVYSDPKVFGKKTGGDIVANKKTFMLITALEKAEGNKAIELNNWLEINEFEETDKVTAVKNIYNELNIGEITMNKAKEYSTKAFEYLNKIEIEDHKKLELKTLGESLLKRIK